MGKSLPAAGQPSCPNVALKRPGPLQRSLWISALLLEFAWIGLLLVLVLRR